MAKQNEAKIKFTAETGGFNDSIKKANDEMGKLRAELKLNETQMQATGTSVEGLESKHKNLESQLAASQSKTEALNQKIEKAVELFGENSTEVTKLRTQLANAQTAEEKIRQSIAKCNDELDAQRQAQKESESATAQLTDKISDQQTELNKLKKDYVEAVLQYGEASDEAKELERSIGDLSSELKGNKTALSNASEKANDLDKSLDNAGNSAEESADGFTVMKGAVAGLVAEGIQAAIAKIGEFVSYLAELPAQTMELRQDFATLTTSFDNMNFSTETATETWKDLYAVFGEDDRAVETANNISKMASSQKELNDWVTITTGVWGTYQDSLPVEGLAEASNETAKTGQVTGVLADALNWSSEAAVMFADYMGDDVVTAEDAFNVALSECTTEQERQALITDTLTSLYGDAADTYRDTASAQMEAKDATAEQILAEANLATALEPVTTEFTKLKAEMLEGLLPAIESISGGMVDAMEWMREHPVLMKVIAAVLGVVAVALTALTAVVVAYTIAQWAMNSAILANPITWIIVAIIAAIAAVVAIIVLVISYWDEIVLAVKNACSAVISALQTAWAWISNLFMGIAEWVNTNVIQPVVNFFTSLWQKIQEIWSAICNAIQVAFMFIGSIISAAVQIITLPFMLIWENCKEYVFAAFEWIKSVIQTASQWISDTVATIWGWVRDNIITPIQETYQKAVEIFNKIRTAIVEKITEIRTKAVEIFNSLRDKATSIFNAVKEKIMTPIQNAKEKVVSTIESLRSSFVSKIESVKSKATSIFSEVKEKMTKPITDAKDKIKEMIDKIKGFFDDLKLKFPNIKLPHFSIKGEFSLDPPSVPKLAIEWYKDGGIMTRPTIFGMNGSRLMAGGEAGPEAILPIDRLEGYIVGAIEKTMQVADIQSLAYAIEDLANRPIQMNINGRQFAMATAADGDSVNGLRSSFKSRGLIVE